MPSSLAFPATALAVQKAIAELQTRDTLVMTLPWRALAITGPDALSFLQGQVTCDVREVTPEQSRLACLLNLKGRVQISGRLLAWPDGYLLLLPKEQLEPAQARLGKYGVFSKITLKEQPLRIQGLLGNVAHMLPEAVDACSGTGLPVQLRLPGSGRGLFITRTDDQPVLADTPQETAADSDALRECWEAAAIKAGEWTLLAEENELFQPQEMDYHSLKGVSYQKGCYLGQEIVARLYFRGQLKTELSAWLTTSADLDIRAGDSLLDKDGQRVGEVIRAAASADGRTLILAIIKREQAATQLEAGKTLINISRQPFERETRAG